MRDTGRDGRKAVWLELAESSECPLYAAKAEEADIRLDQTDRPSLTHFGLPEACVAALADHLVSAFDLTSQEV